MGGGHWNGGHGGWHGGHHRGGRWIGPGIGFATGALVGSALAQGPYYGYDDSYYYDDDPGYVESGPSSADVAYCSQRFKSYNPASGTYLGYDGLRHPCP
jgi:hypothetical protein